MKEEDKEDHKDCESNPCFKCKIRSIGFGRVPGGFKDSND